MSKPIVGVQLTLTLADTKYNLYTLLSAIEADCPDRCSELIISAVTTTNPVLVGDDELTSSRYGYKLRGQTTVVAEAERVLRISRPGPTINLRSISLYGVTTASMLVNVLVIRD